MNDDIAVRVHKLYKSFDLPENKITSLKQLFVSLGRYRRKKRQAVLKGVSFEINKGDFFGIVGRNGSGKSTLLKLLAGVYTPNSGAVELNGRLTPFIELGVGFNPELSGRDNVYLSASLLGYSRKQVDTMYKEIVEFAELEEHMGKRLKNYSSGMQVRLAFSIAIKAKNDILIFDEVLAVGDSAFQKKCREYFMSQKNNKQTTILVTHDMSAIETYCNKAMLLQNGHIRLIGSPKKIAEAYQELNTMDLERAEVQEEKLVAEKKIVESGARLQGVYDFDLHKKKVYRFPHGKDIRLNIKYICEADLKDVAIDVALQLGEGGAYHFYTTTAKQKDLISAKAGEIITMNLTIKNEFAEGVYNLVTSIYDPNDLSVKFLHRRAATIQTGPAPFAGAFAPTHYYTLKREPHV